MRFWLGAILLCVAQVASADPYPQEGIQECSRLQNKVLSTQTYVNDFLYLHDEGVGDHKGVRVFYEQATQIKWKITQYITEWRRVYSPFAYSGDVINCVMLSDRAITKINEFMVKEFPLDYVPRR